VKKYLYGSALLLFLSFLLLQSTSFSNTEMLNKATVSSVGESQALLSIYYGEGRLFWITNNTENVVRVASTGSITPNESDQIGPGRSNSFTILGHPKEISGSIVLDVEWDGGYAMVESFIPQSNIEQILLELLEEEEEEDELEEEKIEGSEEDKVVEENDQEVNDIQDEMETVKEEQGDKEAYEEIVEDPSLIDDLEMTPNINNENGRVKE